MSSPRSVKIILYFPQTEREQSELASRVAEVHADAVTARLKALNCPRAQKLALLDAVIGHTQKNEQPDSVHHDRISVRSGTI